MFSRFHHPILSCVLASSLAVFGSVRAHADDADPENTAPHAPPNAATSDTVPGATAPSPEIQDAPTSSSISEPTFRAETQTVRWPNVPLLATGATVFALSYLPAVVGAAIADGRGDKDLYIPVAGPWMMLANGPEEKGGYKALLIVDGVAQGLGALMLLTSFMIPERMTEHWYLIGSNDFRLSPSRVGSGYGMGAVGRF